MLFFFFFLLDPCLFLPAPPSPITSVNTMVPEILDLIGEFAGTWFLLVVNRNPSPRQVLRDGGIGLILDYVLMKMGGDYRMLFHLRDMVCTVWMSRYSPRGYADAFYSSFTWGLNYVHTDEKSKRDFEILSRPVLEQDQEVVQEEGWETDGRDEEEDDEDDEDDDEEEYNPYIRSTIEERLDLITSGKITDVNYIVCDFVRSHGFICQELRAFIDMYGVEHMSKIQGQLNFRGTYEHVMWLINLCVDLGYQGTAITQHRGPSCIEPGMIHYKYPSTYDADLACHMYFSAQVSKQNLK
ncbi:hypothetical protein BCR42DRAFT_399158 [Absidia repens]|uniref:Uncharacterized protein n=1 Tax=Absidia repens TaxID=90262 RepID=A0A1X2HE20_9FUNG|nr:hypothetical protein BCR42DRAFT_399158 [Absidia repens]